MDKYTSFIFKYKKVLIVMFAILNITALIGVTRIKLNTDFSMFAPNESIYQDRLDEIEGVFGELNQIVVLIDHDNFDAETIDDLRTIQEHIESLENVTFVQGVAPETLNIGGTEMNLENIPVSTLLTFYETFGEFSPLIIEDEGYYSMFTVFINDDFGKGDIDSIQLSLDGFGYDSYISGDTYNQLKITDYIVRILLMLPPLTILVILLVFRWQMGSFKPTFMSVLPAAIGSLWTFGVIGWLGNPVSILTAIVPIFIIVIGSADGLHFMSHFQDAKIEGKDNKTGLNETLHLVGIPMIVTTLTSMAGFISLLTMNTDSIYDLAIFSSVGILLAGVATWYVLPLLLTNNINVLPKHESKKRLDLSKYIRKIWGIPALVIIGIILVVSFFNYNNINNEFNMLMVYKDSTIVSENADKIQEVNGGSIPIYVTIDLDESPITLNSMNEINDLVDELNQLDEVTKVVSPYELINIIYNTTSSGDIPNDTVLNMIYSNIASDENSMINDLISTDDSMVRLLIFSSDLFNDTLGAIEDKVEDSNLDAETTGVQFLMKDLNDGISEMQIYSITVALGIVLVMLVITLRSFKIAVYSLLPILVTVLAVYGFLGVSGVPLNITTVIIFSITIGVGIDYAVHFSSVYRHFLKETNDNQLAIEKAYKNSSRPIITNALGISLGLSILMLSPLTIHFNVSVLMWISMIVSVVITLTLLPFLFSLKSKKRGEKNA